MKYFGMAVLGAIIVGCTNSAPEVAQGHGGGPTSTPPQHVESLRRTYHLKDLQRVTLKVNGHEVPAWVMDDDPKREEGMMWLEDADVKDDEGMIFAFPDVQPNAAFWMENTVLPLDIIFISPQKKVVNIQPGQPFDKTSLPASGPSQYVLEMKQGSAKRLGIHPGTEIEIPSDVKGK